MKVAAGVIFYNDVNSLERCLDSLAGHVDLVFCIDGKFPQFPGDSALSTDGSRDVVRSYARYGVILDDCPKPEIDKRQRYLELCAKFGIDVLIILDSDEYVLDNAVWYNFGENLYRVIIERDKCSHNVYAVSIRTPNDGRVSSGSFLAYPRVWYRPEEMEYYAGKHYYFRNKYPADHPLHKENLIHQASHKINLINGIQIGHDHELRSKQHMDSRFIYQVWLTKHESEL
jgi:hypothetical protein